jgi:MFS family permease
MPPVRSARTLVFVLTFVGAVVVVISSLGAPLIPAIAEGTGSSLPTAQWALTVTLIVGAVATPVLGRLGDGPHRRTVILAVLAVVTFGSVLAALPLGIGWLIVGRALQGLGLGLTPLVISIAREALAADRSRSAIAALSVTVAAGLGLGYPLAGLVAEVGGLHAAFWAGAAISGTALVCAAAVLPASTAAPSRRLDLVGALLLAVAVGGLLLALGEAETWGPTSPLLWSLVGGAVLALIGWVLWELRSPAPLIDLRLARGRTAASAHAAALLVGLACYLLIASVPILAQAPVAPGPGFGVSILVAGLILLPFSVGSMVGSRLARTLADRLGQRAVLPLAALVQSGAFVLLATARSQLWQLFVLMGVAGLAVGAAFAAFPALVVSAVPPSETGSAMSLNQVLRYVGFAMGSALTAAVLGAATPESGDAPAAGGYAVLAAVGFGICLLTAVVTWSVAARQSRPAVSQRPVEVPARS